MNKSCSYLNSLLLFIIVPFVSSCNGQSQQNSPKGIANESEIIPEIEVTDFKGGIRCGFLDSEGILWFGTNTGVYRYNGASFAKFSVKNGLCNDQVAAIIEDALGNLWFGTADGLCRYDRKSIIHIPLPFRDTSSLWLDKVYPIINPNAVHSLALDKQGNIWIGTGGGGAYRYDGQEFTSFLFEIGRKQIDSLYHNWIPSIAQDAEGNMWFGSMTHGGVSRFDGETFTHFMPKDGLCDDMIRSIFLDRSGNIWIGYNGNRNSGLSYYNGDTFTNFYEEDGLCNKAIRAIYEDKAGKLWLGGDLRDLCIYDGKEFKIFRTKEGRSIKGVLAILEDAAGNIWIGGSNGLWRFDGETVVGF